MQRLKIFGLSLTIMLAAAAVARGETPTTASNPLIGTWAYVADGSKFVGRQPYQSAVITFSAESGGIRMTEEVVTANGAKFRIEYLDPQDGTFVSVKGNPYYDSQSTTLTAPRVATRKERRAGKEIGTTVMTVAADGKSFIADASRIVPEGTVYKAYVVWRRIDP